MADKNIATTLTFRCQCGEWVAETGASNTGNWKEAKVAAQIRVAKLGWVFDYDCVKCPECERDYWRGR